MDCASTIIIPFKTCLIPPDALPGLAGFFHEAGKRILTGGGKSLTIHHNFRLDIPAANLAAREPGFIVCVESAGTLQQLAP